MRLLIIEDDRDFAADYLVKAFREVGHVADRATDGGVKGPALALDGQYDVLIVDRLLPKLDGLSVIGSLRSKSVETPVLILSRRSGRSTTGPRACAWAATITTSAKPYSFSELLARTEVQARCRGSRAEETVYRIADLGTQSALASSQPCRAGAANCSRANSGCSNI